MVTDGTIVRLLLAVPLKRIDCCCKKVQLTGIEIEMANSGATKDT
jgi:hypothetical protein